MTHVIDSEFYKHVYATQEMRDVFDPQKRLQRWLDIQAALTSMQARMGLIPQEVADEIAKCCELNQLEFLPNSHNFCGSDQLLSSLLDAVKTACGNREKQGQTTVLLRSLSPGKPNRLNVVCPRFTPGRAPPQIGLFDVT